ncbi:arabinogalactan protein 22 [Perilla frutescens var. hirtella]|uniref:Arabinogalactan protein 22 n=1 Tax=Perilla frutescens var. hirtella TaxID=608512 RepID=A0AAD4JA58_PERFH|nr:arabinogalactan protein 22 [Perilla frutescens var. hirtella]
MRNLHGLPIIAFILVALFQFAAAQGGAPSPAPAPSNDGTAIDQGIAYFLLLIALAVTYLIH